MKQMGLFVDLNNPQKGTDTSNPAFLGFGDGGFQQTASEAEGLRVVGDCRFCGPVK